jgi:hypothetical protein
MKVREKYIILIAITACCVTGCTKPYAPKVISSPNNYLVVEGTINTGGDTTTILLSRTVPLNSNLTSIPELGAVVTIQSNQNQSYSLPENGNGVYISPALTLATTAQYRLSIVTTDGKTYLSDYVTPIVTPTIDSIGFTEESNKQVGTGVQIYVNTHDPKNNTHYYRWDYNETWIFHSEYESFYYSDGTNVLFRTPAQQVYQCWANSISTDIKLGSSAKLTQDVIYQSPLVFIPSTSEKLESRYSILVKQYALSVDAYNYFSLLKQNTEELGSIFDSQPSELTGNIHCTTNATLPVIGYISAGTIQQKRVYINNAQLPQNWIATYPYNCEPDTAFLDFEVRGRPPINQVAAWLIPLPNPFSITTAIVPPGGTLPIGYQYTDRGCADCSIRGTTTKPSFWQ